MNLLLLKLETENWKHCNKIIFKCINSAVEPIFNIFKCMNNTATVCEQCCYSTWTVISVSCTVNSCDFTVHALKKKKKKRKKKKKKPQNAETETRKTHNPNRYIVPVWIESLRFSRFQHFTFPSFFFFFFFLHLFPLLETKFNVDERYAHCSRTVATLFTQDPQLLY